MSLILEALKKSEAERRLGRAPGLMTPAVEPVRRRGWLGIALAMVVVAALAAAAAWWLARRDATPLAAADTAETVRPVANPPASVTAAAPEPSPAAVAQKPPSVPPAGPRREAVPPRSDPAFAANAQERESRAVPASQAAPPALDPAPAADRAPPAFSPAPAVSEPPAAAPVAAVPAEPYVPRLIDLPAAERQDLPPLRLSMHVFNQAPASRFVLIDGRRYSEGQSIVQGLVVAEIRRDGVVLERGGRRFLLQRP